MCHPDARTKKDTPSDDEVSLGEATGFTATLGMFNSSQA
jgi:hypothetical protein